MFVLVLTSATPSGSPFWITLLAVAKLTRLAVVGTVMPDGATTRYSPAPREPAVDRSTVV